QIKSNWPPCQAAANWSLLQLMSPRMATSSSPAAIRARRLLGLVTSILLRRVVQGSPDYMLFRGIDTPRLAHQPQLGCVWPPAVGHAKNGPTLTVDNVQLARRVLAKRADFDRLVCQLEST